ncbi:hypothetical protein P20480_2763 [Pseudoalteromonas sp. BSi20480]|nr:hypothetical protein P20480_2763 [Pseudoalteromonas sp. BSi20480]|tara:strand:+ start:3634 stop:4263 length:630 start_codon:yes stop_codon:yes gene_type:complete
MISWYKKYCLMINGLFVMTLTLMLYMRFGPIAAFALLLLPFAGFLAVKISTVFIILFILFSYFRLHEVFVVLMPLKIPKMLALASLLAIAWHLFISKSLKPHWSSTHLVFVIWFVWLTVCVFSASNKGMAIEYWTGVLVKVFIMVFAISWWLTRFSHFSLVRMGIMISGISVALVALSNKMNGIGLVEGTRVTISREYRSQLGDPNALS